MTMYRARRLVSLVRDCGPGWLAFRVRYAAARRLGLPARATPAQPWTARPLAAWLRPGIPADPEGYAGWRAAHPAPFFFEHVPAVDRVSPRAGDAADAILAGQWPFFDGTIFPLGFPPPWHRDPRDGAEWPAGTHWSQIDDAGTRDIKFVWEPSRFGVAYLLARAWAARADERYPEAFWRLIADWAASNAPMLGANWRCGQEASFRVMAWCFGLHAFAGAAASTPARIARLVAMLAWHGERIAANIAYARSQRNNHAISEGVGLWTLGLLLPELRDATRWRDHGRRVLEEEAVRQIYDDGAYIQHSTNYHRLMLHDYVWAIELGRRHRTPLSAALVERVARATRCLASLVDGVSGQAPALGHNDGALILPLADAPFDDFRPVVQLAHYCVHRERRYPAGPWDEPLAWLCNGDAAGNLAAPGAAADTRIIAAPIGGFITVHGRDSWALLRCARFRDRPAHADQLHVDAWWRGVNVACDAGTYLYTSGDAWANALAGTRTHNTVMVDGEDQMLKAGRFLWLDWAHGEIEHLESDGDDADVCQAVHHGYARLGVTHRRTLARLADVWLVVDDLVASGRHRLRLHWLLADAPVRFDADAGRAVLDLTPGAFGIQVHGPAGTRAALCRGGGCAAPIDGWRSPRYGVKAPALALTVEGETAGPARFVSVMAPAGAVAEVAGATITAQSNGTAFTVTLAPPGSRRVIAALARTAVACDA